MNALSPLFRVFSSLRQDETSAEDEVVIELKSQGEEEALEDQPAEERLPPQAERDRRVPPRPHAARAEAMMHVETEKRLREEDDDEQGWELVKKSTSSYEVLGTLLSSFFFVRLAIGCV